MKRRFEGQAPQPWAQPTSWQVPEGTELESKAPAREPNVVSDATVPLVQAVITGVLVGLVAAAIAKMLDLEFDFWRLVFTVGLLVAAPTWLLLLVDSRRLLWAIEKVIGMDLDGDQVSGPPQRIEVEVTQGTRQMYLELPGSPQALATLARGVLNGRSFAEGSWSGRGGLFSRSEFRTIRDTLIERGLAVWRNPEAKAQGVELTAAGRAVFARLAEMAE